MKRKLCRVVSCRVVSFLLLGALLLNQSLSVSAAAPNTQTGDDGAAGCGGGYVKGTQQESDVTPTAQDFGYIGGAQKYEVKASGTYRLEVWGAEGGCAYGGIDETAYRRQRGGYGGYAKGEIDLAAGDILYIYVGGKGQDGRLGDWAYGGWNGGGRGCNDSYNGWGREGDQSESSGGGGGATHIALNTNRGGLSTYASYKDEVLIVAGGGGGASFDIQGGSGGGTNGGTWSGDYGHTVYSVGGQNSGYAFGRGEDTGFSDRFYGDSDGAGGGGGGWYGGYAGSGSRSTGGTGGSGHTHTNMKNTAMSNGARAGSGYARVTPVKVYGAAGGATGYAAETYRLSLNTNPNTGIQVGNGMFLLKPHNANVTSDYINNASTKDTTSPDGIDLEYQDDSGTRTVKWEMPDSNGTEYEFKAQTYVIDFTDPSGMKLIMDTEAN